LRAKKSGQSLAAEKITARKGLRALPPCRPPREPFPLPILFLGGSECRIFPRKTAKQKRQEWRRKIQVAQTFLSAI